MDVFAETVQEVLARTASSVFAVNVTFAGSEMSGISSRSTSNRSSTSSLSSVATGVAITRSTRDTRTYEELKGCDAIVICVPTPLRKSKEPDVAYIREAAMETGVPSGVSQNV